MAEPEFDIGDHVKVKEIRPDDRDAVSRLLHEGQVYIIAAKAQTHDTNEWMYFVHNVWGVAFYADELELQPEQHPFIDAAEFMARLEDDQRDQEHQQAKDDASRGLA